MKRASVFFTAVLMAGLGLMGCDAPTTPLLGDEAHETMTETAGKGGSAAKATGSGHFFDERGDGGYRNFSFTAQSTGGQWQLVSRAAEVRVHGSVDCVSVVGNEAWFAGPTTQSDVPEQIGIVRGFYVVDNGQGNNNPPDQISLAFPAGDAQAWCDIMPQTSLNDVENGNVKVH